MTSRSAPGGVTETGYDATFEPEPDRKYLCPVCLSVLRDPVQTKCGHRFCKTCLRRSCGGNIRFAKCPVDNTWLDIIRGTFEDIAMKREVLSLTVRCRHHDEGCNWLGELRSVKLLRECIMTTCPDTTMNLLPTEDHEVACPRAMVDCTNQCGERMRREEAEHHLNTCQRRLVQCQHCEEDLVMADLTKHELLTCPRFPVTCAVCQKTGLLREDIPDHVDLVSGDCPLVTVKCAFHHAGCYFQTTRQAMGDHHREETHHHLLLLAARLAQQDEQLTAQREQLTRVVTTCQELTLLSANHERQLMMNREQLQSQAGRLQDLQRAGCSGRLLWKINLPEDNNCQLRSPYFYTGRPGYRLSLTLELAGFRDYNEIYSSIYVNLEKGDYDDQLKFPFEGVCHVTIHDQSEDPDVRNTVTTSILCSRVSRCNDEGLVPGGCHQRGRLKLMRTNKLLGGPFVHQGALLLQIDAIHFHAGESTLETF